MDKIAISNELSFGVVLRISTNLNETTSDRCQQTGSTNKSHRDYIRLSDPNERISLKILCKVRRDSTTLDYTNSFDTLVILTVIFFVSVIVSIK